MDAAGTEEHTTAEPKYTSRRKYEQHSEQIKEAADPRC
jgi:hypothetical protein